MITAIYDGHCVICNTTRRLISAMDWLNRVEFLDLHNRTEVETRFPALDYDKSMGEIHVIDQTGNIFAGFYGTRRMLKSVPLGWPFWLMFYIPGVGNWLGPKFYRFIARNRYQINKMLGVDLSAQEMEDCEDVCKIPGT